MKQLRVKATRRQKAATHKATKADYKRMAAACKAAIVMRSKDILISFPYFAVFAPDFPKGIIVERTPTANVYKIKAQKLMDWLHKHGHSPHDYHTVVEMSHMAHVRIGELDRMLGMKDNDESSNEGENDENSEAASNEE